MFTTLPRHTSIARHAITCGTLLALLGCNRAPRTTLPATTGYGLCQAAAEVEFFETLGDGQITIVNDANAPAPGIALVRDGQRFVILNPKLLSPLPEPLREMILAHEVGHHFLGGDPSVRSEFLADAFAARVLTARHGGVGRVEEAARYMEQNPRPGDATHPSDDVRATYIRVVYRAFVDSPEDCSPPPPDSRP